MPAIWVGRRVAGVGGLVAFVVCCLLCLSVGVSASFAEGPWWGVSSVVRPSVLAPEGKGEIALTVENYGDANADGSSRPVRVRDQLPGGLVATAVMAAVPYGDGAKEVPGCKILSAQVVECEYEESLAPYSELEVRIAVAVQPGAQEQELVNDATVSGGGASTVSIARPVHVGDETSSFGLEEWNLLPEEEGGAPDTQAGSHPFQVTGSFVLRQGADGNPPPSKADGGKPVVAPVGLAKDIVTKLPVGLVGNPTPIAQCTLGQFLTNQDNANRCAADTAVGVAAVTLQLPGGYGTTTFQVPIFNLEPYAGEPARFGFFIPQGNVPVILDTSVRTNEKYAITVGSTNITQTTGLLSVRTTFWGNPGDPRHNESRGWSCLLESINHNEEGQPCTNPEVTHPPAFLTLPTDCEEQMRSSTEIDAWNNPAEDEAKQAHPVATTEPMLTPVGCNRLGFTPTIGASPTTTFTAAASGLNFNIDFKNEGLTSAEGDAQSELKETTVVLPEGLTINPSAGVGLAGCTPEDYERETLQSAPGAGCPDESKLGTVSIETPLLTQRIEGNVFIAQPYENPFPEPENGHPNGTLVALYVVAKNPETGVLIKLAGKVTPNPVTGRLTTTFANNPQLPFDHFNFHFREGAQAPLITPPACGSYTAQALLAPWSTLPGAASSTEVLTDSSSFTLTDDGDCPSGTPFHPGIVAGALNNNAGAFSPLYVDLSRGDAEQEISGFSTELPEGLTGDLTGVPFCPDASIEAARNESGAQEEANPSCPASSAIGHTQVGTGVGQVLAYVPGKLYLAGPFRGAPFSLVSITSAKVGPFDLGTVVLRFGLNIDPYTAKVSVNPTSSEPIPTILDGIVTHVRDIKVYVDRPGFTINPTSCEPKQLASTLTSNLAANASTASPFQTVNCANLKFAPKFTVTTQGKTSKSEGASLHVDLTYPSGPQGTYADIAKVKVELPKQLPSRLTTLQKACTAKQFEIDFANCPAPSVIGTAKAVVPNIPEPLAGPVYFVSHGGEAFPSLEIVLQGYGVKIILVGSTFISKTGITSTTFKAIPDNPVTSFELTLPEGKYSALAANGNLCALTKTTIVKKKVTVKVKGKKKTVTRSVKQTKPETLEMPTEFTAQNGARTNQVTQVSVTGCPHTKATKPKQKTKAKKKAKSDRAGK